MQQKFTNPYHFVPVEKPVDSQKSEHWLSIDDFYHRELQNYSHAKYHSNTHSGRIVCRLTTESAMFIGASQHESTDKETPAIAEPFELDGKPAIPASTLRGLISSIVESASNSSLRVLHDQVLSYRKGMGEGLPAIGMVIIKENEEGTQSYYLKPLALPILEKLPQGHGYTYGMENEQEKLAYFEMFRGKARLKVYVKGYDIYDEPVNFLENKTTFTGKEFYYARLREHKFVKEHGRFILPSVHDDSLHGTRGGHVDAQNTVDNSPIITEQEWKSKPIEEKNLYTRGILRILGKKNRDMPDTKKYELFIPYPDGTQGVDHWADFHILPEAVERFHQLADERVNVVNLEKKPPDQLLPYEPLGTERNENPDVLKNELKKKGIKNGDKALRLKHGDLVYFRPTIQNDETVVAEIAFSSIWRGRVEDDKGENASVHRFFKEIDPELLPFHKGRNFISPAELLFGFTQKDEDEKDKKKSEKDKDKHALAGRVQVSFGQVVPKQLGQYYDNKVLLKSLLSPKLPCPAMYFKNSRYTSKEYIYKHNLKPVRNEPQGRKMYVHSHTDNGKTPWKSLDKDNNRNLKTYITPISENTEFYFHIDFNNLSDWELGMLFYALRPNEEFRHKLGMGKNIGLGKARIDPVGLFLINREERYRTPDIFQTPRYHAVWTDENVELPSKYEQVKSTANAPNWKNLREEFCKSMSHNIKNALELLGNPDKVQAVVHTPQVNGKADAKLEQENFKWFVNNNTQMLKPLNENSENLPTLNR